MAGGLEFDAGDCIKVVFKPGLIGVASKGFHFHVRLAVDADSLIPASPALLIEEGKLVALLRRQITRNLSRADTKSARPLKNCSCRDTSAKTA